MKPVFSITMASRRNSYYKLFHESLKDTEVPFEIVFVGPNPPLEQMPDNFKHIYSTATPCQCTEIAVRNATGEYVLLISDDCQLSDGFLDKLHRYTQSLNMDKASISFRFYICIYPKTGKMVWYGDDGLMFDGSIIDSHALGCCPMFRRDIWMKLGGLDKRFHSTFCDIDMQMRFYEYGMNIFIPPDCIIAEVPKDSGAFKEEGWNIPGHPNESLLCVHGEEARSLLNSLWIQDGTMSKTRLSPVEPFTEES